VNCVATFQVVQAGEASCRDDSRDASPSFDHDPLDCLMRDWKHLGNEKQNEWRS
jgi:hypothetical protein